MTKKTRLLALLAALAMVLVACGDDTGGDGTTTTGAGGGLELKSPGVLTVCTDTPYPPMEFIDENGEYTGFDIELMAAIADDLGLEMEIAEPGFEAITGGLAFETDCDVAAASITITEEREEAVDFTDPYFDAVQSILVREDSGINSLADMVGKRLAVQTGTTGAFYAAENAPDGVQVVEYQDADGPFLAIESGEADGFMTDLPVTQDYVERNAGWKVAETFDTGEQYGFATRDTPNLLAALNASLAKLRDDGTYDEIYSNWFDS
ncbi:MAG TPA: transporter substrate-binding domain-containing protein [Acidimicrobiia bacterium]